MMKWVQKIPEKFEGDFLKRLQDILCRLHTADLAETRVTEPSKTT